MQEFSKEISTTFEIRKNRKQKDEFIHALTSKLEELEYTYEIQETKGLIKNKNVIVGNIQKAKVICTAHYDTCATMAIVPNFITPLNTVVYLLYQIVLSLGIIGLAVGIGFVIEWLTMGMIWFEIAYIAALIALFYQLLAGYPNPKNYNDNTSGVVTLLEILMKLPKEEREKVAFVFFDNEEKGLLGSMDFASKYGKQLSRKMVVNYDCVGDGDTFFMKYNRMMDTSKIKEIFERTHEDDGDKHFLFTKKGMYPSDQKNFDRRCFTVAVAALKHSKLVGLYMDRIHTPKDTMLDATNIQMLSDRMVAFIREI